MTSLRAAIPLALLLTGLLVAGAASARSIVVDMHDFYFTVDGGAQHNPTITVNASESLTIRVVPMGTQPHNFHINGISNAMTTPVTSTGNVQYVNITAPSTAGDHTYVCDVHPNMTGTFKVQGTGGGSGTGGTKSPGFEAIGLVAAALVVVAVLRRK